MNALLVNDDGYKSPGLRAMRLELAKNHQVTVVAPTEERSWTGKSITGFRDLSVEPIQHFELQGYSVDGTPADCTQLGLFELSPNTPDFVVSGINLGANIGHAHILSSGTIGAAMEAALQGVPAFATSVWRAKPGHASNDLHSEQAIDLFTTAAQITAQIIKKVLAVGFPKDTQVIAINLPFDVSENAPWYITRPHAIPYGPLFELQAGRYHNTGNTELHDINDDKTDLAVLIKGGVSIVPLQVELTSETGQQALAQILDIPIAH